MTNFLKMVANCYHKLTLKKYIHNAQELADHLNQKVYCIKYKGKPKFMTRDMLKDFRSRKIVPKNFTSIDLQKLSLFFVIPKSQKK